MATQAAEFSLTQHMMNASPEQSLELSEKLSLAAASSRLYRLGSAPRSRFDFSNSTSASADTTRVDIAGTAVYDQFQQLSRRRVDSARSDYARDASIKKIALQQRYASAMERRIRSAARNSVSVLRKYRLGELLDIQLERRDLVLPLVALQADAEVAKRTFVVLLILSWSSTRKTTLLAWSCAGLFMLSCIWSALSRGRMGTDAFSPL
jgi:hypothetical protein